jgi:hypothetical protein
MAPSLTLITTSREGQFLHVSARHHGHFKVVGSIDFW